jgi:hypothetical protein
VYSRGQAMEIREQPNRWSCVAAAFATVLDMNLSTLIEAIGHDGSEIMFEDLPEPICRRAFNLQELGFVLWRLGYVVGHYDVEPLAILDEHHIYNLTYPDTEARFKELMDNTVGVGCGLIRGTDKTHAFAWNGLSCYDPTGFIYPLSRYELYSYHPVFPRSSL